MFIFLWTVLCSPFHGGESISPVPNGGICLTSHQDGYFPRNYRSLFNENGFPDNFRVSASAQPTAQQLSRIISCVRAHTHEPEIPIYIVDLRQELHGFLENGLPIYITQEDFWRDFDPAQTSSYEKEYFANLNHSTDIPFFTHIVKDQGKRFNKGDAEHIDGVTHSLFTEKQLCEREHNVHYIRLPLVDHERPTDAMVENLLDFFKNLPQNAWIHVHCHAGKGRTSTVLLMYHLFKKRENNLQEVSRLHQKYGSTDLLKVNEKWSKEKQKKRADFVQNFFTWSQGSPLRPSYLF